MTLLRSKFDPGPRVRVEVEPYTALAQWYDEVMTHVDYLKWSMYITRITQYYHKQYHSILDFACGTGKLLMHLSDRGYHVVGVDGSREMVERARRASMLRGKVIDFYVGDMRKKPPLDNQDMVLCLYDSVNYLMTVDDVNLFLTAVRLTLQDEGMFIFDLSTEQNSLTNFTGYEDQDKITGGYFIRRSNYDPKKRIQHNVFELYPDGEKECYIEHHQQRIWPVLEMVDMLEDQGFRLLSVYDGMSFMPGSEESDRVHIVAVPS
ncbi:MAG TPA: class I SAM-dependent methyltransferase [Bacteroidetes bacterium]|nr:class I SAM-dependent methyltransferase [Bacteroidota bacterium]